MARVGMYVCGIFGLLYVGVASAFWIDGRAAMGVTYLIIATMWFVAAGVWAKAAGLEKGE